ncbi:MAG: hypothetical protein HEP71_24315 [Roseivirga sp.]|nr:hypothetical protein [Roseivirga sp.]
MKQKLKKIAGLSLMIVLGIMWAVSGWFGVTRDDPSVQLEAALQQAIEQSRTIGFYKPFLTGVVLPNKAIFASLVGWGELLIGISFLSGTLVRLSTWAGVFMLLNYGLMNGALLQHLILVALMLSVFLSSPSRIYGFDRMMHRKWPSQSFFKK